ncbi:MAG: DUF721 domain-containing protein [Xanthomonadaceae bacterium]|jgi:hypothetical protein|nr:DUF721 domain-containing protein [Xanthomonadaceae bacterium]
MDTKAGPALAGLVGHARLLEALDQALRGALPPTFAPQVRLANVRGARLVFLASSPAVATRLRLMQDAITAAASRFTGTAIDQLTVKVAPMPVRPHDPSPRKPLSSTAAEHLRQAASILDDPELRDLFQRLASLA